MVVSTNAENGEPSPSIKESSAESIPFGNYKLVGWDMDTTGRRFVDEIVQIVAYTKDSKFAQYIMPFRNLTPPARKRHNLKVVSIGKYRILKNGKTNKVIKTKSVVSAIIDFLEWLEKINGDTKDGIILVHHESRKVNPPMLLDALIKHKLLDRFKKTVKGFLNGFDVASDKCASTLHAFSNRFLSRALLNQEEDWTDASSRARVVLQIFQHLCNSEENNKVNKCIEDSDVTSKTTFEFIREFVQPTDAEVRDYKVLKLVHERQESLQPLFKSVLQTTRRERHHATSLRQLLAEANIDYIQLKNAWSDGQEVALTKLIKENVNKATEAEVETLLVIIESHFDPSKKIEVKIEDEHRRMGSKKSQDKPKSVNTSDASPDTTTLCSPIKENNSPTVEVESNSQF